jgi:hypothetical protein
MGRPVRTPSLDIRQSDAVDMLPPLSRDCSVSSSPISMKRITVDLSFGELLNR